MWVNRNKLSHNSITKILWAAILISLPITSFRYFPFLGKSTYVRPLALYPLVLLFPLLVIHLLKFRKKTILPGSFLHLGVFLLIAFTTTIIAANYTPVEMRGHDYWERTLRAWVTVIIWLALFFCTALGMSFILLSGSKAYSCPPRSLMKGILFFIT